MRTLAIIASTMAWFGLVLGARAQCQTAKLTASDMLQGDAFGQAVALSGDWALIGKPQDDEIADQSGAAYFYLHSGANWPQYQKLKASDAAFGDAFGYSVALSGTVAVVGAPDEFPQGVFDAGAAYVFEFNGGNWVETAKIWASDASPTAHFGFACAVSGDRLLIGAKDDAHAGTSSGSAYVFERSGASWIEVIKLTASDAAPGDAFGRSVALDGNLALIGAPSADGPTSFDFGAAYVFENLASWTQVAKLTANDGATSDFFGMSVGASSGALLIGASAHDHAASNAGAVYAFERPLGTWVQMQELLASDATAGDQFGASLAVDGSACAIGSNADDDQGFSSGSAYAFRRASTGWAQIGKFLARDGADFNILGTQVAISGVHVLAGAVGDDDACPGNAFCGSGSAYVFEFVPQATQYGSCASGAPCGNVDSYGGCANTTGAGALLAACGSSSVSVDDLRLEVTHLPPNAAATLFMGSTQILWPLGDGLRVVGAGTGALRRFPLQQADALGGLATGPGIVGSTLAFPVATQIHAGQTWNFQCWYRDATSACGGHTNLSNGLSVDFTP
jgi:hypothetical protein